MTRAFEADFIIDLEEQDMDHGLSRGEGLHPRATVPETNDVYSNTRTYAAIQRYEGTYTYIYTDVNIIDIRML